MPSRLAVSDEIYMSICRKPIIGIRVAIFF